MAGEIHLARRVGSDHPVTPDGRYFVVRGRLWRMSDPWLDDERRGQIVSDLMRARGAVARARRANDAGAEADAHSRVDRVKIELGERGPAWWDDGAPDFNRHMVRTTPYAEWYARLPLAREQWAAWLDPSVPAEDVLRYLPEGSVPAARVYPPPQESAEQRALSL